MQYHTKILFLNKIFAKLQSESIAVEDCNGIANNPVSIAGFYFKGYIWLRPEEVL